MKKALVALAAVFLLAHVPFLPPTLEDIDSVNFALGVRDFDVARHQPHPPGYPIFIALGRASTSVMRAAGVPSPEVRGLAIWSVLAGTALIFLLFAFFRALDGDERRAWWATLIGVACPLFWFTALRPLSDTSGLAAAVAAQALLAAVAFGRAGPRSLLAGAFIAGLAIGIRSQTFVLTLPLLALVLVLPRLGLRLADRVAAMGAASIGVLAWGIPLIAVTGGLTAYAEALGTQAGEDFSGVVMLWTSRSPRVAAEALMYTFLWPWGALVIGGLVAGVALAGAASAAWRAPRVLLVVTVAFLPYAVFHLLFHEVVTVRYALPLVVPVAYLFVLMLDAGPRTLLPLGAGALTAMSLMAVVPAAAAYARDGSPTFSLLQDVERAAGDPGDDGGSSSGRLAGGDFDIAFHAGMRRAIEWETPSLGGRMLKAPHGREWLTLVSTWRTSPDRTVAFIADPRRTDLALFDPHARRLLSAYRWPFIEPPFVGGARPGNADWYMMRPPGWMLDRGWAVTPEVAGVTARDRLGPHQQPSVAWLRARGDEALLMIGGRHLGRPSDTAAHIVLSLAGREVDAFDASPGTFFRLVTLPVGALAGTGYVPLQVTSSVASGRATPVALEQFDLQSSGTPMAGAEDGWQEPEYNPATGRSWRWMSERATLWVRPIGRDVTLTVAGESPLRYFDRAPVVKVTLGGREIARFQPASDFRESIVLPAGALAAAGGRVAIESDQWFTPADREGSADRRHLALRIYAFGVH